MILELRVSDSGREVVVTSRFSRYLIEEDEDGITLSARGLERSYSRDDFPLESELASIAAYLVVQLEAIEIGLH